MNTTARPYAARRPSRFVGLALLTSLVPFGVYAVSALFPAVPFLLDADYAGFASLLAILPWLGAGLFSVFTFLLAMFATARVMNRRRELKGRLIGFLAMALSLLGIAFTVVPITLFVGLVALIGALLAAMGPMAMGRPRGAPAATPLLALASDATIWRARAHDEAQSIVAFLALAADLERHSAPESLVHRARKAAIDEARHTVIAEQHAGEPIDATLEPPPPQDLEPLIHETLIKGSLGEAFAARILTLEGVHDIARDEAEHAALADDIVAWAATTETGRQALRSVRLPLLGYTPSRRITPLRQLREFYALRRAVSAVRDAMTDHQAQGHGRDLRIHAQAGREDARIGQ